MCRGRATRLRHVIVSTCSFVGGRRWSLLCADARPDERGAARGVRVTACLKYLCIKSQPRTAGQDTRANRTRHTSSSSTRPHAEHRHTKAHMYSFNVDSSVGILPMHNSSFRGLFACVLSWVEILEGTTERIILGV